MTTRISILFLLSPLIAFGQPMPSATQAQLPDGFQMVPKPRVVRTNITVVWDHPQIGSNWLRFNLYSTTNILIPIKDWPKTQLATNIITVNIDKQNWFCTVTALNIDTGVESDYATKDKP